MHHYTPLISLFAVGLVLAFVLGTAANRLRLSLLVGYLLAGVVIGPATPGYARTSTSRCSSPRSG